MVASIDSSSRTGVSVQPISPVDKTCGAWKQNTETYATVKMEIWPIIMSVETSLHMAPTVMTTMCVTPTRNPTSMTNCNVLFGLSCPQIANAACRHLQWQRRECFHQRATTNQPPFSQPKPRCRPVITHLE
jgi:hypothetical protein